MATTMMNQKLKTFGQISGVVLALAGLSGLSACTSASSGDADATASGTTASASASATAATSAPPTTSTDTSASPSTGGTDGTGGGTGSVPQCETSNLTASLGEGDGAGAGHMYPTIVLTNSGDSDCALKGYPGVSLVTGDDGTQLGAAAEQDTSGPERVWVTMAPGESVQAQLDITQAANYDESECEPKQADGFRIYPPGETESLFLKASDYTGCANEDVVLMKVRALEPVS